MAGFLAGLGLVAGTFTVSQVWVTTSEDRFCSRCHGMHPYFAAHRAGAHREIACRTCHIGPGAVDAVQDKIRGLSFLLAHRLDLHQGEGIVDNRACTQAGCHPDGGGDGLPWRGTWFHHSRHVHSGRPAQPHVLRCTHCHNTALERGHGTAVDRSSCRVCHLGGGGVPTGGGADLACLTCHGLPMAVDLGGKGRLDHAAARAAGHRCRDCHAELDRAGLPIQTRRCVACHPGEPVPAEFLAGRARKIHFTHGVGSSVPCRACHGEPDHHMVSPWHPEFPAAGRPCGHAAGGSGDGPLRSFVRITCTFCHRRLDGGPTRQDRCRTCHD